jgi:Kinesin motor domain
VQQLPLAALYTLQLNSVLLHTHLHYAQVYKDKIYDLLSTSGSRAPLRIREDSKRGITEVGGLTKRPAANAEEALEVIQQVCTLSNLR